MKILVIFTGGTIVTCIKDGWASIDNSAKYKLLNNFDCKKNDVEFVTASPYNILSENLSATELNLLQKEIQNNLNKDFDGIIVTHGTDTLQYTASAIEYAFNGCSVPIVFVSADYPLENPDTNGYANFEAAVNFIKSGTANGIFVSYKNNDCDFTGIHIASRILQHREWDSNIYSTDGKPFAIYNGTVVLNDIDFCNSKSGIGITDYVDNPKILCIESFPGNNYAYCLDNVNAVILKPYHSGTLDTANKNFQDFCSKAKEKNVPVFLTNAEYGTSYESSKIFNNLNIKVLPPAAFISMYIKIWAAISRKENIEEFVSKAVANEFKV